MAECNLKNNAKNCPCTYPCEIKGKCYECIRNHLAKKELPACCFPADVENNYDRSIDLFCQINMK
jgi:hypothetical protein